MEAILTWTCRGVERICGSATSGFSEGLLNAIAMRCGLIAQDLNNGNMHTMSHARLAFELILVDETG